MKKLYSLISLLFIFSILCGCSRPLFLQDVNNIVTVDYSFNDGNEYHYSFDLEKGSFHARLDDKDLDASPEYELEQSEIDAIRNSIVPLKKWPFEYKKTALGLVRTQTYTIAINYADGSSRVFKGETADGAEWPEGFDELRTTFDGIALKRLKEKMDPESQKEELIALLSDYDLQVRSSADKGYDWLGDDGYLIHAKIHDEERLYIEYKDDMFFLGLSDWSISYNSERMDYEDMLAQIKSFTGNEIAVVTVRSGGEWKNKWIAPASECSRDDLILQVNSNCYIYIEELEKDGYQIECKYFDKTKDIVYTVDPV